MRLTFHNLPAYGLSRLLRWLLAKLFWLPRRFKENVQPLHRPDFSEFWQWEYTDVVLSSRIDLPNTSLDKYRVATLINKFLDKKDYAELIDNPWPPQYIFDLLPEVTPYYIADCTHVQQLFKPTSTQSPLVDSRSAKWFVDRLFNGIGPQIALAQMLAQGLRRNAWTIEFNFADCELKDGAPMLQPTCRLELVAKQDLATAMPELVAISLCYPTVNATRFVRYTPASGKWLWAQALWAARSAYLLAGEIDEHITCGHVATELALFWNRNFWPKNHWLGTITLPHLRDADGINDFGDNLIFSQTGVFARCSPLSADGVFQRVWAQRRRVLPWHWSPPISLGPWHGFGEVSVAIFRAIEDHVRQYSGSLATQAELTALEKIAITVIYRATFLHGWCNDAQIDDGGELAYACFGLLQPVPETQPATNELCEQWVKDAMPDPRDGLYQLFLAYALTGAKAGTIIAAKGREVREAADHETNGETMLMQNLASQLEKHWNPQLEAILPLDRIRARVNT